MIWASGIPLAQTQQYKTKMKLKERLVLYVHFFGTLSLKVIP